MKKIKVVREIAAALDLKNVKAHQKRAEEWKDGRFDFVVTRAVARQIKLFEWSARTALYTEYKLEIKVIYKCS